MIKKHFKTITFFINIFNISIIYLNAATNGNDKNYQINVSRNLDVKKSLIYDNKNIIYNIDDANLSDKIRFVKMSSIGFKDSNVLITDEMYDHNISSFIEFSEGTASTERKPTSGHWISYSAIGAGLIASIVGYSFQNKANGYYQDYSNSKIPTDANRFWKKTNDCDKLSNISFGIGGGLIVFGIVYHYLIYDNN